MVHLDPQAPHGPPSMLQQGLARYLSTEQLQRLAAVRLGVAGAGGLGSNCALMLARSGIRHMVLADHDVVEASNLNRQQYGPGDIGQPKVSALQAALFRLDSTLDVVTCHTHINAANAPVVFSGCSIVVEAFDGAEDKAMLCNALTPHVELLVSACGLAGVGGGTMRTRRLGPTLVCVGDFTAAVSERRPPLAPRVTQAASMQADAVLEYILGEIV